MAAPTDLTDIVWWNFQGGDEITFPQDQAITAVLPGPLAGLVVEIDAVGGDLRYQINGVANANSHGFVPENGARIIGPLQNWESLSIYAVAAVVACLTFYRPNIRG